MEDHKRAPFEPINGTPDLPAQEAEILKMWEEGQILQKTLTRDAPKGNFVFFEGPPTANNKPHPGHVLTRVIKDLIPRFKTMQGYRVQRKAGWDTHGLPVEIAIEKRLGLDGKKEIEAYGIEAFNRQCYESVQTYERDWVKLSNRIGFWLDYDDAYFTFTNKYVESVWWILGTFFERGHLFEGHKVLPYCPLCGTTHSSHEVAQAYKPIKDPSTTIRFRLLPGQSIPGEGGLRAETDGELYALAWTTTPWTLPSNVALAVHPDKAYILVQSRANPAHRYLLAEGMAVPVLETLEGEDGKPETFDLRDATPLLRTTGAALQDLRYERLYTWEETEPQPGANPDDDGWRIVTAEYVTLEDGTGIVHTAPAFGEEDYQAKTAHGLPFLTALGTDGRFRDVLPLLAGKWFRDANPDVIGDLKARGLLFRSQRFEHSYPHCWRHNTPLYYSAQSSWFVRTTAFRDQLIANNQQIDWKPAHIQNGRFGKWLEGVVDWALSRKRYWGTPLPIWRCAECGDVEALKSYAELFARSGQAAPADPYDTAQFNPHRPYIDDVALPCACGGEKRRVEEVIDCWFDSGAMPFAQHHYPFENKDLIEGPEGQTQYPANFISEAIDQTRGWFYTLHAISTILTGKPAYKRCYVMGHVLDGDGLKMSKSLGNVLDPWDVIDTFGADAFRWHFYSTMSAGQPARFSVPLVRESVKGFLIPLWNAMSFFTIYANIDGWTPGAEPIALSDRPALDRWILSRLSGTIATVTAGLEDLDFQTSAKALEAFLDQLNNWYIRRSRRRFWSGAQVDSERRSGGDADPAGAAARADKEAAYQTLHHVLATLSHLLAPFLPFGAESIYQRIVRPFGEETPESVHLTAWPQADASAIDADLEAAMAEVLRATSLGLSARNKSGIKVRQPLERLWLVTLDEALPGVIAPFAELIQEELNVNAIEWAKDRSAYVSYRVTPNFRLLGKRFGKQVPLVKKAVMAADPGALVTAMERGGQVTLDIEGQPEVFTAEELDVQIQQREGTVTANDESLLAALDTEITPALRQQGLAREIINRIQSLRREADLAYTDKIAVTYAATGELADALETHRAHIQAETQCESLRLGDPEEGEHRLDDSVEEHSVSLGMRKV